MLMQSKRFARLRARGLSLVEMLVGMVVGLFIVGGAVYFTVNFNSENRRLLLEARLTQDMRAAMDIVTRDLRRAGYWQNASSGVSLFGSAATAVYNDTGLAVVTPASGASASSVSYYYDKSASTVATTDDYAGFDLNAGVLRTKIGASASQPLTDDKTMIVDVFNVSLQVEPEDLSASCTKACVAVCPALFVRTFSVTMTAHAVVDSTVRRTLRSKVRVRNDLHTGACPP
jgi:prepilin peptidase dependent protein B